MKKIKTILFSTLLVASLVLTSCEDNAVEIVTSCSNIIELSEELGDLAIELSQNPTTASCEAYKAKINDFIEIAEDCDQIPQSQIDELKAALLELDCSDI
jgi:hypothetical protein